VDLFAHDALLFMITDGRHSNTECGFET
jgi:hypothetical protein